MREHQDLARYSVKNADDCYTGTSWIVDYSRTYNIAITWEGIAVTGSAGEERILLFNTSGEVLQGENDDENIT